MGYNELLRGPRPIHHPATGMQIGTERTLQAEFAKFEEEVIAMDPRTGQPMMDPGTGRSVGRVATIHGGRWDADEWQEETGATDEERKLMMNALWRAHRKTPHTVFPLRPARIAAPVPGVWDNLSSARKLAIAAELGAEVLANALAYEQQEGTDQELVARLAAKIQKLEAESAAEAALTAA